MTALRAYTLPAFSIYERIGTSAMLLCPDALDSTPEAFARLSMRDRADHWLEQGYAVEWHDRLTWFVATHESKPTVYCCVQEVQS